MSPRSFVSFAAWLVPGLGIAATGGCAAGASSFASDAGGDDSSLGDAASSADAVLVDTWTVPDASHEAATDSGTDSIAQTQDASDAATDGPPTTLDLHQATIFDNPTNLADWPVTTLITDVEFQYMGSDGVHVEFSKRDGTSSWPDVTPPGWTRPLEYTLGMAEYINGQWYASASVEFWRGLPAAGGNVAEDIVTLGQCTAFGATSSCQVAKNWYYDSTSWAPRAAYPLSSAPMYYQTICQMKKMLAQLDKWLDTAEAFAKTKSFEPDRFVDFRLAPDQFPFARQVQGACDTAKLTASRLTGKEAPVQADSEKTLAELHARVQSVIKYLDGFSEKDFAGAATRVVSQPRWEGKVMSGADYFMEHGVPNFFFHLTHAYAILRHNGVDIGKRDYLGALSLRAP